jgi:putative oxidoreductase
MYQQQRLDNDLALLLGRICMAVVFLPSGVQKLFHYGTFADQMATKTLLPGLHLPFPALFALLAVAIEVGGPILLLLGVKARWVALLMIAFVIMATLTTHRFWEMEGAAQKVNQSSFFKNVGLIAGFFFLYVSGAGALSVDGMTRRHSNRIGVRSDLVGVRG